MRGQITSTLFALALQRSTAFFPVGCLLLFSLSLNCVQAQASPPITQSGLHTTVSDPITVTGGTQYDITGGTRPGGAGGTNLFHSFGDFSVPTNNIANFLNVGSVDLNGNVLDSNLPTSNILGRVTGGDPSVIFGMIQTNGPNGFGTANLFLMNPAGFLFGPNATVNVGGMMTFTTADYLRFQGTDTLFNKVSTPESLSLLSTVPVAAFGFLGLDAASITVQGSTIKVAEGQTLSLIGGNRTFEMATETPAGEFVPSGVTAPAGVTVTGGTFIAPSGHIYIASVDSAGEVIVSHSGQPAGLNVSSFSKLGLVELSGGTMVDVSTLLDADFNPISDLGNGSIHIRGGQFVLDGATITAFNFGTLPGEPRAVDIAVRGDVTLRNSSIQSSTVDAAGGTISVTAQTIRIEGSNLSSFGNGTATNGDIVFGTTGAFSMDNTSLITSEALFGGNGGTVNISAGSVAVKGGTIRTTTADFGSAGNLDIQVDTNLAVMEGGRIESTGSFGASGNISVAAGDTVTVSGTGLFDSSTSSRIDSFNNFSGSSGTVDIQAGKFILSGNALVETGSIPHGLGGNTIHANDSVSISDGSRVRMFVVNTPGGVVDISANNTITIDQASIRTRTGGNGDAGTIILSADNITMVNGQVASDSAGRGHGGDVTITASGQFTATGQFTDEFGQASPAGVFSQALSSGNGGDINITAGQSATLSNGSSVSASSTGPGNTGNIQIDAGNLFAMTDSSVTTEASQASGGAIKITTNPGGTVQLINSLISASVLDGMGGGGSVNIDPQFVILLNSQILAKAFQGPGGNISITTNFLLSDATSVISASSQFGVNGTVTIQSPNAPISGHIQPLGKTPLLATSLLNQRCAALAGGEFSSFIVAGRDSLPTEPGSWLASPLYAAGVGLGIKTEGVKAEGQWLGTGEGLESMRANAGRAARGESLFSSSGLFRASNQRNETNQINQMDQIVLSLRQIAPAGFLTQAFAVEGSSSCQS